MDRRDGVVDYGELLFGDIGEGDRASRRRGRDRKDDDDAGEEPMDDIEIPIDIIENMRGRSVKDHVNDEAVGREIERR